MLKRNGDYAVGYGRPPAHSRFRKGQSGNPKGRTRGRSLTALLHAALDETVTIELRGRRRRVSKAEAVIEQLVDGSIAADRRSQKLLLDVLLKLEGRGSSPDDPWGGDDDLDAASARERLIREFDRLEAEMEETDGAGWVEWERQWRERAAQTHAERSGEAAGAGLARETVGDRGHDDTEHDHDPGRDDGADQLCR